MADYKIRFTLNQYSHTGKNPHTAEELEKGKIAEYADYREAYRAAALYLDREPTKRVVFLQSWRDWSDGRTTLTKEYFIPHKPKYKEPKFSQSEEFKNLRPEIRAAILESRAIKKAAEREERRRQKRREYMEAKKAKEEIKP